MTSRTLRLLSVLVALSLVPLACGDDEETTPDAGTVTKTDAGTNEDAGATDEDAGSTDEDAGSTEDDAGTVEDDAGSGNPDAGTVADAGETPDAGPVESCGDLNTNGCLWNGDCTASQVCQDFGEGDSTFSCCVTGARGSGAVGSTCTANADCEAGLCLERDDGAFFCSGECGGDFDCPGFMACSDLFGWCYPRDADAPVESCTQVSLDQCFLNDNCPTNARCENLGTADNEVFCCTPGERGTKLVGEACASELECEYGRCLEGLCSADCDFDNDPCPPETMYCDTIRNRCEPL